MDTLTPLTRAQTDAQTGAPNAKDGGAGPPPLTEIRIGVAQSPTAGRVFFDRGEHPPRRPLVDVGRVEGKPELHVLRTPEGRISLIGSHWLEPAALGEAPRQAGAPDDAQDAHAHEPEEEDG